jgi:CRISPR-associated endonuclease/helicase Cas3
MEAFFAHSVRGRPQSEWEPLADHLAEVGRRGAAFAAVFAAEKWGELAGLWHDLGKYSARFQEYLASTTAGGGHGGEVAGRIDHSTAGAQHAAALGPLGRLLAYCIAGHHAGLPDGEGTAAGLRLRLQKPVEAWLPDAPPELVNRPLPSPPRLRPTGDHRRDAFAIGFFTRMLFSCLVDADYLATEAFLSPERAARRPRPPATLADLLARLDAHLAEKQRTASATPVNRARQRVLAACGEKARLPPGLFSLNVPTGGGKTLSSLAFALAHGAEHGLRRVLYGIPFTSIIEQTGEAFRAALGDLGDQVLEHHSDIEPDDPVRQSERSRLSAENFDASLIVTTNVQLFESLFSCKPSRCRKLHRLARSVIVLDEAQALPPSLLAPTLAALDELVRNYRCSVVLCTATQPAIERRNGFPIGLDGVRPIIDDPQDLHAALQRTRVELVGRLTNQEVAERLSRERQVLCVVNSRRHAADLFRLLEGPDAFHLSASMCAAHRAEVLATIRLRVSPDANQPCRVVSTQVIEAGVDVDFPCVYRAAAGLDSVAQAAGRCNREGLMDGGRPGAGRVYVFDYDERAHRPPPLIRRATGHFREVAPDYSGDLLSPPAVEAYFRLHYWQQGGDDGAGWDRGHEGHTVMRCFGGEDGDPAHHQFRQANDRYRLIDDAQIPVLVPYGIRGQQVIDDLASMPDSPDPGRLRTLDRAAQRYVVRVWGGSLRRLLEQGLFERHGRYYLGDAAAYDPRLGLSFDALGLDIDALIQ